MVAFRLAELMHARQVRFLQQVADGTGISRTTLTGIYYNQTQRVDLATLEKLCAFFDCQPGDLLRREE